MSRRGGFSKIRADEDFPSSPPPRREYPVSWILAGGAGLIIGGLAIAAFVISLVNMSRINSGSNFSATSPLAPDTGNVLPLPCGNTSFGTDERTYEGDTDLRTVPPETGNVCSTNVCGDSGFWTTVGIENATCWFNAQCGEGMRCDLTSCGCVPNVATILVETFDGNFTEGFESIWDFSTAVADCNYADFGEWVDLSCNVAFPSQNSTNDGTNMDFVFELPITGLDSQPATGTVTLVSDTNISDDPMNTVTVGGPCEILSATQGTCLGVNTNSDYNANIVEGETYTGSFSLRYQKG